MSDMNGDGGFGSYLREKDTRKRAEEETFIRCEPCDINKKARIKAESDLSYAQRDMEELKRHIRELKKVLKSNNIFDKTRDV